ncbi:hypothetical protein SAMN05518865_108120 [Duganella sp. CF458]|uniref:SLATT domain-containing protein n=1 Tax=Duganella sp. CF458 TaxID=1884368 RepID=UPI0008E77A49|nr:SLATT domain-containing protein [Duganella sp. CF458]SFG10043.1 hypothetical protein SAMN05518865_108120 [Duganella sp. CF458]
MNPAELIQHWRFRNHRVQLAHYDSARFFAGLHLLLGVPASVLSTLVGTAIFSTLSKSHTASMPTEDGSIVVQIAVGFLSVLAAILTGLQTFLKNAEQAERHRIAGARFANLKHRIELVATLPPSSDEELRKELLSIESRWAKLREESPTLPTFIWKRIERSLPFEDHQNRYPGLGNLASAK